MITLYAFGSTLGLPDASPFVMKAEMLLKMAGLPYQIDTTGFRRAPKGKLPYIDDDGQIVADSTFIRWHIEQRYQIDFDQHLSATERAMAWAVEKLLEDHLYWALLDARWGMDENFARYSTHFFGHLMWPLRNFVAGMVRRSIGRALKAQGMGRHTREDRVRLAAKDIDTVATLLGDKPYLMGEQCCGADATLFAFIAGTLCPFIHTPIRTAAEQHPNLVAYNMRMMRQYFPKYVQPPAA